MVGEGVAGVLVSGGEAQLRGDGSVFDIDTKRRFMVFVAEIG
jgi:hypothetical protein